MIKYLGSKRLLLDEILAVAEGYPGYTSVLDLFSGTSRVGRAFKEKGFRVIANDHNAYAHTLAKCYVAADKERYEETARELIADLQATPPAPGYITETFSEKARFFQPHNGAKIDAIRERIAQLGLDPLLEAVALVSLMEAADRVDSTTGVQMAFLKQWAHRSHNNLDMRVPDLVPASAYGDCEAVQLDALEAASMIEADIAYLDPPYNQHSYLGNYHIWETLVRWDKPETYGIAQKRVDVRERKSVFNSRPNFAQAFRSILEALRAKLIIVSFNNEGFLSRAALEEMLLPLGEVQVIDREYKRYIGARIGIYNPSGEVVGSVGHLTNRELIYVCDRTKA